MSNGHTIRFLEDTLSRRDAMQPVKAHSLSAYSRDQLYKKRADALDIIREETYRATPVAAAVLRSIEEALL